MWNSIACNEATVEALPDKLTSLVRTAREGKARPDGVRNDGAPSVPMDKCWPQRSAGESCEVLYLLRACLQWK